MTSKWQTIENAPEETPILGYFPGIEEPIQTTILFSEGLDEPVWMINYTDYWGWNVNPPTHWMTKPEPPEESKQ